VNGRPSSTSAQLVIDCSGRAGVVARRLREYEPAYRTYAIVGVWRSDDGWELSDETHTVVETFEHGWAWSVPVDRSTRHVGAMVDGTSPRSATGRELEAAYRGEIAKTVEMRRLLGGAGLRHSRDFARQASERHPHPFWAARAGVDVPLQDDMDAPDVRAAFERIKGASSIVFRLADDVRLEKAAVIRDHEIVVEDAFP